MTRTYARFIDFGKGINDQVKSPLNPSNPLSYCLFPTLNSQFIHGSSSSGLLYDTNNANCTNFMAQRCEENWDGFCDAYQMVNVDTYWPNTAAIDSKAFELAQFFLSNTPSVGDNLLRNTVYLRFIRLPDENVSVQPFDPNVANSPTVNLFTNMVTTPSHLHNLDDVDNDSYTQKMLENPKVCFDVLARIYLGHLRREASTVHLTGTRLLEFLERNASLFQRFLDVASTRLASFQEYVPPHTWHRTPCPPSST